MKDILGFWVIGRAWGKPGCWLVFSLMLACLAGCGSKGSADLVYFDVGAGPAVETLKEAARQADVEFIFSSDLVQGLKTPAVRGKYAPKEAFERLLADSPYLVVRHPQSGVYSIQRSGSP